LRAGAFVTEEELLAFVKARINEPPALPRRLFVLEQLPLTAVGKIYKPALREDCARRHLMEVLQAEPITSLAVRDDPARGRILCIELGQDGPDAVARTHQRIADTLKPYLLSVEWSASQAAASVDG
jgi:fatty-acyl-CoA synthase